MDFRFETQVRVRFAETDAQAIAHHSVYLVWFELARIEYLERFRGGYPGLRETGIEALTTGIHLEYERAAVFDDVLTVGVRCAEIRGARFRYEYLVEREGEALADGWTAHACVDARTHRPTRVPGWLADEIATAEG